MWKKLQGNKTNLGLVAAGVTGVVLSLGWIDEQTAGIVGSIIGAWTGIAIRSAYSKGK